jgi:hypothetical protein
MRSLHATVRMLRWILPAVVLVASRVGALYAGQFYQATGIPGCGSGFQYRLAVQSTGSVFAVLPGVGTCGGVYRSTDYGHSYRKVGITNPGFSAPRTYDIKSLGGEIYVATDQGVWTTTDTTSQIKWTQHQNGLPEFTPIIMVQPIFGTNEIYAAVDHTMAVGGIYRSTNNAKTWNQITSATDANFLDKGLGCGVEGGNTIVAASHDPGGLWVSRDNGVTWAKSLTWPTLGAYDVGFDCSNSPTHNHLYVTNLDLNVNAAVYRSTDYARTFVPDNQGIPTCCASIINPFGDHSNIGTKVGSWGTAGQGAGMFERTPVSPPIGTPWIQFTTVGLPQGAVIVDWDWTPAVNGHYVLAAWDGLYVRFYYYQ